MRASLVVLVAVGGCAPVAYSPPGRMLALDTAKTLDKGQTGIRAGGGGGTSVNVGFAGGFLRVRHGVAKNLDLRVELSALSLNTEDEIVGTHALASAGAGIKYAFNPHFAIAFDLTGGYWRGGGFLSPEVNFIAAYENRYIVPFLDGGYYTSHPLSPNTISIETDPFGAEPGPVIEVIGPPVFTQGWVAGAGFRFPTSSFDFSRIASALILGTRFIGVYYKDPYPLGTSERDRDFYWNGAGGFEVIFR